MSRIFAALLAATACAGAAVAQSTPTASAEAPLTLADALAMARAQSPGLAAADAGIRVNTSARTVAGLRPNPSIEGQVENVAGTGPYRGFAGSETTVGVSLPIETGGKRTNRIGVADARINRARLSAAVALADLDLQVTQAFVEAVASERRVGAARDLANIATEALRVATDRVTVGAASPIEQQRAEVLSINAKAGLERAERSMRVARDDLGRLIGQPMNGPLDTSWFDRVDNVGPTLPPQSEGTLALAVADADLAIADAQVLLARSQRIPDVTVSAGARRFGGSNDVAAVVGVSIPIPLFNSGNAAVGQAKAERNQMEALRRLAVLDTNRAIAQAQADVANAATAAKAANGPALAAAQEAARIARIGYGQGALSQLELLDAERTLAETRAAATDALAAYHGALARLRRLTTRAPADLQPSGDQK